MRRARVIARTCELCGQKDYSTKVRKGKLQKKGLRVCDNCMEHRIYGFCEFNGVLLREGDLGVSYLVLSYLDKPIYYHWGEFTYSNGRPVSERVLKRLAKKDELIRLLMEGHDIDMDFLNDEIVYFDFGYHINEEARNKLIVHIKEYNSLPILS